MEALLTILVGSPALQTLSLINSSPTTSNGFPVQLKCFSALTIRTKQFAPTCLHLLRYLIIPPSTMVDIFYNTEALDDYMLTRFISYVSPTSATTYDTIRVSHRRGFAYHLFNSARPWWSCRFKIKGGTLQSDFCHATRALMNTLKFSNVTTLHLTGATTAGVWIILAQHLHRVQTLHLHETTPASWLDFLLTQAMFVLGITHWKYKEHGLSFRAKDGSLAHAWPGLRCLSLHKLNLGHDVRGTSDPLQPSRSEMLRALLWARREGGARITRLEIEDCRNVFSHDLMHFRLFSDVEHDGKGLVITTGEEYESLGVYSIDVLMRMLERADGCSTKE
ncbi:hypothetical protein MSAN_00433200 [Mycena sanguinolenta]|uniref:Uncharacterized protein n=1 Tax=Mycena sanguinolenta TaxID=230812 RepID=A0A8H6ZAE7_9AGAR|nr:hypothetical protein MSAN_00433200 [Mycena sanguinolenta]